MTEEDRLDIIESSDEEGNQRFLKVEKYFYYNGEEYVLLREVEDEEGTQGEQEGNLYVMMVQVSQDEEGEEVEDFVPIDNDLMETLIKTIKINYKNPQEADA
jgi:uncharacterized protein YrzB (UPF0473 family)